MKVKWYYCRWCGWDGWCNADESPNEWAWNGCGCDASEEHQGGPHKWILKGKWHVDDEPDSDQYIG